jgi:MFS family permease
MSGKRSPWAAFGVLALIEFAAVMDASVVNIALPSIGRSLHFSPTMLAWVVDGYLTGLAGFMLVAGRATDLIGRRVLFLAGVAAFTAFSGACALAAQPWQLIVSRVGQGAGAALAMPSAIALITDLFPEGSTRNKALGMFSGMAGVAAPAGLVLGGALTAVSWRWIFLINVPVGLIVVTAGLRALPAPQRRAGTRVDLPGALALTGGLIFLTLAVLRGGAQGWGSAATLAQFGAAAALLAAFGVRQASVGDPLIPRELLRSRAIVTGNLIFVLVGTILLGTFFITTLFLQQVRVLAPLAAALIYLPVPAAMLAGTLAAPRLLRLGPPNTLMGALALQAVALAAWALLMRPAGSLLLTFLLPATVWAFGLGLAIVSSFVVCTSGTSPQLAGAASGLATTAYQGGGAIGLALLALVADTRTRAAGAGPAALTTGFTTALWVSAGIALTGAIATRIITRASAASRDSNHHEAAASQLR